MPRRRATVCKCRASMATRTVPRLSAVVISVIVPTYNEAGSLPTRVACLMGNVLVPVRDATSGFFAVRRTAIDGVHLNAIGFKIGLEVIARAKTKKIVEVPYTFRDRELGASKFGRREVGQYLQQLGMVARDKVLRRLH